MIDAVILPGLSHQKVETGHDDFPRVRLNRGGRGKKRFVWTRPKHVVYIRMI